MPLSHGGYSRRSKIRFVSDNDCRTDGMYLFLNFPSRAVEAPMPCLRSLPFGITEWLAAVVAKPGMKGILEFLKGPLKGG